MHASCNIQILALRRYASGYRGCLVDQQRYVFFQYSRNGRLKELKSYPRSEFDDLLHFVSVMQKFMSASAFLIPPIPIEALTINELDRLDAQLNPSE